MGYFVKKLKDIQFSMIKMEKDLDNFWIFFAQ